MRGEAQVLPVPFPRFFTPGAFTENGRIKPPPEPEKKIKDEFILQLPTLVKLA
jgi:hypothetical protein